MHLCVGAAKQCIHARCPAGLARHMHVGACACALIFLHARQAKMPRKWKYVAAAVVAAHVVIALILAMGSKRTALLGGVRMSALSNMSRADAWNPQVLPSVTFSVLPAS